MTNLEYLATFNFAFKQIFSNTSIAIIQNLRKYKTVLPLSAWYRSRFKFFIFNKFVTGDLCNRFCWSLRSFMINRNDCQFSTITFYSTVKIVVGCYIFCVIDRFWLFGCIVNCSNIGGECVTSKVLCITLGISCEGVLIYKCVPVKLLII